MEYVMHLLENVSVMILDTNEIIWKIKRKQ